MLANFMIGLREGLEAALVIGIIVAYLKKQSRVSDIRKVSIGVIAAILLSILSGLLLSILVADTEAGTNQIIGASASILAVIFVTWMIFWMAKHSRSLPSEMHNKLAKVTSTFAVVAIGFFAVVREGVETSIFLWSSTNASEQGITPIFGAVIGLASSAAIGYGIYRGSLKLNLRLFFAVTSGFLILVSAGILAYAVMELEELHWFPFLQAHTYDVSNIVAVGSPLEIFLKSTLSFNAAPTQLQTLVWFIYLLPIATIYWLRTKPKKQ
jgi:high-affinity iron transporter